MTIKYLDAARPGRNQWWRYILGLLAPCATVFVASFGLTLSLLTIGLLHPSDITTPSAVNSLIKKMPIWAIYMMSISVMSIMGASILVWIDKMHQRNPFSVICPDPNQAFNLKRCFNASIVWFSMSILSTSVLFRISISDFQTVKIIADPISWLIYLIPAIALILINTLSFGIITSYILQGVGLIIKNKLLLAVIIGLMLVCISALNNQKEPQHIQIQLAIIAFIYGVGTVIFILKENGLELVLGIQAASSLVSRFIAYQPSGDSISSVLPPSIISIEKNTQIYSSLAAVSLIILCIKLAVFYAVFLRRSLPLTQE